MARSSRSSPTASTSRPGRPRRWPRSATSRWSGRWRSSAGRWTSPARSGPRPALRTRQPLATAWIAVPDRGLVLDDELLALFTDELNVQRVEVIEDGSALVERRVKPLLPKIGKRLGAAIPAVMTAAREGAVEFHADGSVTLGGVTLAADEVEIQATPRPGTAVADRDGLVVVLDTELTRELRARGRRPRAPARDPGPAQGGRAGPRRPDRPVGRRGRRGGRAVPRSPWPPRRSPTSCGVTRRRTACRSRRSASRPATRGSRSGASATGHDPVTGPGSAGEAVADDEARTDEVEIVEDEAVRRQAEPRDRGAGHVARARRSAAGSRSRPSPSASSSVDQASKAWIVAMHPRTPATGR